MRKWGVVATMVFLGALVRPALAAEFLTAEFGTDPPVLGPARSPSLPALARAGANLMVTWDDHRGTSAGIALARVGRSGVILDPANIVGPAGDARGPALACDPAACLIVFERGKQILGFRVGHDGGLIDKLPFMIATSSSVGPAVAFNGTEYLVAWVRESFAYSIMGVRVSSAGAVRETPRTLVDPPPGLPNVGSVFADLTAASDGAGWVLAFREYTRESSWNVSALRVGPAGTAADPAPLSVGATTDAEFKPAVSFDGSNYLVVWYVTMRNLPVMGARVPPAGAPGAPFAISPAGRPTTTPAVAFDGVNQQVVWHEGPYPDETLHATRVSPAGAVLDAQGLTLGPSPEGYGARAAPLDGGIYLAWYDRLGGAIGVYGRPLDRSGNAAGSRLLISRALNHQEGAAAAAAAGGFLWAWMDLREGLGRIYAVRLGPSGQSLDAVAFAVGPGDRHQMDPAVASDGRDHLVVWGQTRLGSTAEIVARRVSASGAPLGTTAVIAPRGRAPAVAHGQGQYLVTWTDPDLGGTRAARVADDGQLIDTTPIMVAPGSLARSRVASDGKGFLVIWGGAGVRIDAAGKVVDATPLMLKPGGVTSQSQYDLAFGAGVYLMIWESSGVHAARIDPATGGLIDPNGFLVVDDRMAVESHPFLAFDGASFLVAWKSIEFNQSTRFVGWKVELGTINPTGGPVVTRRTIASLPEEDFLLWSPALAANGGRALVSYQKLAEGPGYHYRRVFARALTDGNLAPGGRCGSNEACATGFCVDGVCCRTACAGGPSDCQACSTDQGAADNGTCGPVGDGRPCPAGQCSAGTCRPLAPDAGVRDAPRAETAPDAAMIPRDAPVAVDGGADTNPGTRPPDAGVAGSPSDAGKTGTPGRTAAGCSCGIGAGPDAGGAATILGVLLLGAALAGRRRSAAILVAIVSMSWSCTRGPSPSHGVSRKDAAVPVVSDDAAPVDSGSEERDAGPADLRAADAAMITADAARDSPPAPDAADASAAEAGPPAGCTPSADDPSRAAVAILGTPLPCSGAAVYQYVQFTTPPSPGGGGYVVVKFTDVSRMTTLDTFLYMGNATAFAATLFELRAGNQGEALTYWFAAFPATSYVIRVNENYGGGLGRFTFAATYTPVYSAIRANLSGPDAVPQLTVGTPVEDYIFRGYRTRFTDTWSWSYKVTLAAAPATVTFSNLSPDFYTNARMVDAFGGAAWYSPFTPMGQDFTLTTGGPVPAGEYFIRVEAYMNPKAYGLGDTPKSFITKPFTMLVKQ